MNMADDGVLPESTHGMTKDVAADSEAENPLYAKLGLQCRKLYGDKV